MPGQTSALPVKENRRFHFTGRRGGNRIAGAHWAASGGRSRLADAGHDGEPRVRPYVPSYVIGGKERTMRNGVIAAGVLALGLLGSACGEGSKTTPESQGAGGPYAQPTSP